MIDYENLNKVNRPYFEDYRIAFDKVLESGWFVLGTNVEAFEKEFAEWNNSKYCAGLASGLDALTIALLTLDLPKGSEVIVPSNTYIATILSIMHSGHIPVLVEPDITTYNINPFLIEKAITSKTRAMMVVHLYGKSCDMDPITDICRSHRLFLIEDCAQAHGAQYKGRKTGTFGDMAAFSFYPTKNLGCLGDGGALVTNNEDYDRRIRMIRNYGSAKKYHNDYIGMNSRLDEVQASFLRIKLRDLENITTHKRKLAGIYLDTLNDNFVKPSVHPDFFDVYHIFNIRHQRRDELRKYLLDNGVMTEIHYPVPPHRQKAMLFLKDKSFPVSEEIHATTLSLPVSVSHDESEIRQVVELINKF